MKIPFDARRTKSGSVLVITLLLGAILVLTLGGYMWWVRTQNLLVAESQAWNAALALAEAGIEEGLAQLNVDAGNIASDNDYVPSITANWNTVSPGVYKTPQPRSLTSGSYSALIMPDTYRMP